MVDFRIFRFIDTFTSKQFAPCAHLLSFPFGERDAPERFRRNHNSTLSSPSIP